MTRAQLNAWPCQRTYVRDEPVAEVEVERPPPKPKKSVAKQKPVPKEPTFPSINITVALTVEVRGDDVIGEVKGLTITREEQRARAAAAAEARNKSQTKRGQQGLTKMKPSFERTEQRQMDPGRWE